MLVKLFRSQIFIFLKRLYEKSLDVPAMFDLKLTSHRTILIKSVRISNNNLAAKCSVNLEIIEDLLATFELAFLGY